MVDNALTQTTPTILEKLFSSDKSSFSYWRFRMLYATLIGYAGYYLVRQNFAMAIPGISEEFGYTKTDLGWIVSCFTVFYGAGKLINGYISDRSDARYFMTFGLVLSAIISLLMGFGTSFYFFAGLACLNGCFQSMGWPACARLITHWFSPKELGSKWALWATSHQIGGLAIFGIAGVLIENFGWRSAFTVPAFLAIGIAFFLFNRLRDTPKEVGLPPVEEYKKDTHHVSSDFEARVTLKEVLKTVFLNRLLWYMAIANTCLYVPRTGFFFWGPTFLKEYKGVTLVIAGVLFVAFEIAGIAGGLVAGWASDKIFQGRRGPVGTICLLGFAVSLFLLLKLTEANVFAYTFLLMISGFFLNGSQVLNGVATADFASKKAVGVATGFTGSFAYIGAAIASGAGFGKIVENYGWETGFMGFIVISLIGACFYALTWNNKAKVLEAKADS